MDCKEIRELLSAYSEGVVSPDEKRRIEEHLPACPQCSRALVELQETERLTHSLEEVEPPPWLTTRVMAHVREEAAQERGLFARLFYPLHVKIPLQALATILIGVMTYQVYRTIEPEIRPAKPPSDIAQVSPRIEPQKRPQRFESPAGQATTPRPPAPPKERPDRTMEEEKPVPSRGATEPLAAKKEKPLEDRLEGELKMAAPPAVQKEVPELQKAPVPAMREVGGAFSKQERSKDKLVSKAAPAAIEAAVPAAQKPGMEFTLRAGDREAAANEVERALSLLGGRTITRESREGMVILTGELTAQKVGEFFEKVKGMGEAKERPSPFPVPEGDVRIRLEISGRP